VIRLFFGVVMGLWPGVLLASPDIAVQVEAATPTDFADAVDAVNAGFSPDQAVLEQDAPYREHVGFQNELWLALFNEPFDLSECGYYVDRDAAVFDPFMLDASLSGVTSNGHEFTLVVEEINGNVFDPINDAVLVTAGLTRVWDGIFTIQTPLASVRFLGIVIESSTF